LQLKQKYYVQLFLFFSFLSLKSAFFLNTFISPDNLFPQNGHNGQNDNILQYAFASCGGMV